MQYFCGLRADGDHPRGFDDTGGEERGNFLCGKGAGEEYCIEFVIGCGEGKGLNGAAADFGTEGGDDTAFVSVLFAESRVCRTFFGETGDRK